MARKFDIFRKVKRNAKSITTLGTDFSKAVDLCLDDKGGIIRINRKDEIGSPNPYGRLLLKADARDFKDVDIENYLLRTYGGGDYYIQVVKFDDKGGVNALSEFSFSIDGPMREDRYDFQRKKVTEAESATTMMKESLEFAKGLMPNNNNDNALVIALIQQNNATTQALIQQMSQSNDKNIAMMMEMFQRSNQGGNSIGETLESIIQLSQIKDQLAPNVQSDKEIEMLKIFSPVINGFVGKMVGVTPQAPYLSPAPQEQLIMPENKPKQIEANPLGGIETSTPLIAETDPPIKSEEKSIEESERDDREDSAFEITMLEPLYDLIGDDTVEAGEIATVINQMINWTMTQIRVNKEPHPLMVSFALAMTEIAKGNFDIALLEKAYSEFARQIEMPSELTESVKIELAKLYMPYFAQMSQSKAENN